MDEKGCTDESLDGWELLPDNQIFFLEDTVRHGELFFDPKLVMINMSYFTCSPVVPHPSPCCFVENSKPFVEKNQDLCLSNPGKDNQYKDIGIVTPPSPEQAATVALSHVKSEQVSDCGEKLEDLCRTVDELELKLGREAVQGSEEEQENVAEGSDGEKCMGEPELGKEENPCTDCNSFSIWKWRVSGIGALCSVGFAAATVCILLFGGRQQKERLLRSKQISFQIYADDEGIKQVVQQASRLNQAMSVMRGFPATRAGISFGGYYDGI